MEPEASLPCSQEHATGSYTEPLETSPQLPALIRSNIILPSMPRSLECPFPFTVSYQIFYTSYVLQDALCKSS